MLLGRAIASLACAALLTGPVALWAQAPTAKPNEYGDLTEPAIPPGQEELLATMLGKGATLASGCKLTAGSIEHTLVRATYACPEGEVVLQVGHPSTARAALVTTAQFALTTLSGTPPATLPGELTALVKAREAEFAWQMPPARGTPWARVAAVAAALLAIATGLGLSWRRRRQADRARGA
ncbi:MAG: hypothetical protein ACRERC_14405 [Candidatus Binatia bacterium]